AFRFWRLFRAIPLSRSSPPLLHSSALLPRPLHSIFFLLSSSFLHPFPPSPIFFQPTGLSDLFFPPYSVTFPFTTTPIYRPAERNCITLCPARANFAHRDSVFGFCSSPRSSIFVSRTALREGSP